MSETKEPIEAEVLASLPDDIKEGVKAALEISIKRSWSGPLPPPEVFKQYPPLVQEAIVKQATAQMKHRQKIESKVVASNIDSSKKGMGYAFWLTIGLIIAGVTLVLNGQSTAGLVAIFSPTAFVGGNFVIQKWREMRKIGRDISKDNNSDVKQLPDE